MHMGHEAEASFPLETLQGTAKTLGEISRRHHDQLLTSNSFSLRQDPCPKLQHRHREPVMSPDSKGLCSEMCYFITFVTACASSCTISISILLGNPTTLFADLHKPMFVLSYFVLW